jgi:hypothetical protein
MIVVTGLEPSARHQCEWRIAGRMTAAATILQLITVVPSFYFSV